MYVLLQSYKCSLKTRTDFHHNLLKLAGPVRDVQEYGGVSSGALRIAQDTMGLDKDVRCHLRPVPLEDDKDVLPVSFLIIIYYTILLCC